MKINWFKAVLACVASLLIGLLCFAIAKETDGRNWISFVMTAMSLCAALVSAIAIESEDTDKILTNMKVTAWLFNMAMIVINLAFSFFEYNIILYIVVIGLLLLACVGCVYAIFNRKK